MAQYWLEITCSLNAPVSTISESLPQSCCLDTATHCHRQASPQQQSWAGRIPPGSYADPNTPQKLQREKNWAGAGGPEHLHLTKTKHGHRKEPEPQPPPDPYLDWSSSIAMSERSHRDDVKPCYIFRLSPWCPQAMDSGGTPTEVQSLVLHPLALPSSTNHFISSSLSSLVFKVKIIKSTAQGVVRRLESVYVVCSQKSSVCSES